MEERNDVKGVGRFLFADGADDDRLHLHITEVGPGTRAHPPHSHKGQEIFYVLLGQGEVEVADEVFRVNEGEAMQRHTLSAGEAIQVDCKVEHGISNIGTEKLRYAVIIAR